MSWLLNRLKETRIPFEDEREECPQEKEKEINIYCIQFDKDVYWLPSPVTVPRTLDTTSACIKILCERAGFEKITKEEKTKRLNEIHEKN